MRLSTEYIIVRQSDHPRLDNGQDRLRIPKKVGKDRSPRKGWRPS